MKYPILVILIIPLLVVSCAGNQPAPVDDELMQFAKANCMFAYFKKKNYDLKDIRAISGGIVEMGSYSADKYQAVAELIKSYKPDYSTKHPVDADLLKCFKLESDAYFIDSLNKIKI